MNKSKTYWIKLKSFIKECKRVVQVTKKPSMKEFKMIVKVTGLGIIIIGFIGFLISITGTLLGI
ncbi:protein translocase SEC61 complex subunit gamma [Candidatus Woesearchaeota archaeon]|nr:MAG: protein translocase SEC61 complex subunit gamma [Candidatus Woesearchaeota archaeon]